MTKLSFETFLTLVDTETECVEPQVAVEANYYPGSPGSMYRANGDPGDPPEDDEVEVTKVTRLDTGEELDWDSLPSACQEKLEEAARDRAAADADNDAEARAEAAVARAEHYMEDR